MAKKNNLLKDITKTVVVSSLLIKSINENEKAYKLEKENLRLKKELETYKDTKKEDSQTDKPTEIDVIHILWQWLVRLFLFYLLICFIGYLFGVNIPDVLDAYFKGES